MFVLAVVIMMEVIHVFALAVLVSDGSRILVM
jgi:hypothetical protein